MRRGGMFGVPQLRPWSWQGFLLGAVAVLASAAVQAGACAAIGAQLHFATFLPAIFVVGLLAGVPAAAFAILLSVPLVWWAFMPPFFEFSGLTASHAESINLFLVLGLLLVGLADLCRHTMVIISRGGLKTADESVTPSSQ